MEEKLKKVGRFSKNNYFTGANQLSITSMADTKANIRNYRPTLELFGGGCALLLFIIIDTIE